ncbi:MAG: sulfite exporter TauE/SafE family protein [Gammaproteobacteria bacterium]|nr:sulfite exporter TauE/SafE family protein [Gammaproteobacteria bacterium]
MLEISLIYFFIGVIVGLLAGLFGVGGGLVIVPALVFVFARIGVNPAVAVHLAIGTSLATIILTSMASVRAHHRRGAVLWPQVKQLTPGIFIGAAVGAMIADALPASVLRQVFAFFEWAVGLQILLRLLPKAARRLPGWVGMGLAGTVIGTASSIIGIGGGTLTVPFLLWCNVVMQRAVATASACGLPIAIAGALSYVATGVNAQGLPAYATGYVYWPAVLGITFSSVVIAPLGAALAHRLPADSLRRYFGVFLIGLGVYMFV